MAKLNVREQAIAYVTRLYSGELTAREESQIRRWREEQPEHELEWQTALQAYDFTAMLYHPHHKKTTKAARHDWLTWLATAASVSAVSLLVLLQSISPTVIPQSGHVPVAVIATEQMQTALQKTSDDNEFRITERQQPLTSGVWHFETAVGEVSNILLADGSTLSLNTQSALTVAFSAGQRLVTLSRGEVFFDVAKDANRPFIIDTGERQIKVIGTKFNVRKLPHETLLKIAVLEGKVAVKNLVKPLQAKEVEAVQALLAGDIAAFSEQNEVIQQNQPQQVSQAQTWRQGIMRFDNESLDHVVQEFNRYRTRKITIIDEQVKNYRISGVFHLADGEAILSALEATLPIRVAVVAEQINISNR
ncbi:FecR family protein [Alishewanella sp. HL-SH05]|uniref:FecR family protein n=1 Tax=Alishewanella sp. HL-SH05 TaxID=3461145 RepID=UPI004041B39B